MKILDPINLAAAKSEVPWPVDLVKITVDPDDEDKIIRITNHHHDINVEDDGLYTAVGSFLGFSDISDELEIKNNTLDLSLSGINNFFTAIFLGNQVEGSLVEVNRAYYSESDKLIERDGTETTVTAGDIVAPPERRWSGRVNNSSIQDDFNYTDEDKIIISVSCKSLFETLFKRQSGRFTSSSGFRRFNPTDRSMEFMATMASFNPSFGKD